MKPRTSLVLAIFAVVFVGLQVAGYRQKSATWDEPIHVAMGYAALAESDYRIDPEHPPLLRMWAALPLLFVDEVELDTTAIEAAPPNRWALGDLIDFSRSFLYSQNADQLLYSARFMIVLLGVALGVLLFSWASEWFGFWTATAVLALYTVEPNLSAHSSLVTTDFGLTCFAFGAIYFLWRTSRSASAFNVAGVILFIALAAVSKYTALVLGGIVPVLLGWSALRNRSLSLATAGSILVLAAVVSLIAVWAAYGFRYAPSDSPSWLFRLDQIQEVRQRVPGLTSLVETIDNAHLLPNALTQGLLLGQAKAQGRSAFLMGMYGTGWWYYFPVAILIKTPIALLLLALIGAVVWARHRRADAAFVVVPIVMFLGVAMISTMNIGVRHVLPVYPFVLMVAGAGVQALIEQFKNGGVVLATLLGWAVVEFGIVYPNTLAFFNQAVGGPRHGIHYLTDSNIDWGQDLKPLKRWMDQRGVASLNLSYFGLADPAYYGIEFTAIPGDTAAAGEQMGEPILPGYVAVSATNLMGVYSAELQSFYRPLREREPITRIGESIYVYWMDEPWW